MALIDGAIAAQGPGTDPGLDAAPSAAPPDIHVVRPEQLVAEIWADVLGLDAIDPDDDFFDLGGDSLSAAQILTRVSRRFNFRLTEGELFTARTVRGVCAVLRHATGGWAAAAIAPRPGPRVRFPASSAQRRLWILDRLVPNPEVYSVPFLLRIHGTINVEALRRAFEAVDARHESLRIHLEDDAGEPVQIVGEARPFELSFTDLRELPEADRRPAATHEATACAARPIPLTGDRLWRAKLYRTGTDEFLLWVNMHHAITDGWSWGVFFKDLESFYEAARDGKSARATPLKIQYGDYAQWERDGMTSAAYRRQLNYWAKTLTPPAAPLDLPFARPRSPAQTFAGAVHRFDVPKRLVTAVDGLSRRESVTRFTVGLAAFQAVLHRYTGADDVVVGSPVAGRNRGEVEPLVGMFVNTLVLRTSLAGDPTFRELLERVRQTRLGALAHPDVPLDAVVEAVKPARDPSRAPLFQIAFYYQNITIIPERFSRHAMAVLPVHNGTAMFDLRFVLEDGPFGGLWGWVEYNTDLFEPFHIERMVGHFLTVLADAAAAPDTRLSELSLLTTSERDQLVRGWNQTAGNYPDDDCLHDAFARWAAETPAAVAVFAGGETFTYRQIDEQSNRLARHLLSLGVRAGDLVGVCVPRSVAMVSAVLAIVKAGGAYVPLDPTYPKDRLAFMLKDANAAIVLTHSAVRDRLPDTAACLVLLDQIADAESAAPLDRVQTPDSVAYVIYTSGSTGQPKGVVVCHRAAVNTIDWVLATFGIGPADCLLTVASLSFDLSVYDIFGTLGAGATLRIASVEEVRDPARLAGILRAEPITVWNSAPAAFQQIVPFLGRSTNPVELRLVLLSGDWIPVSLPDQVRVAFPAARVVSLGGATEAAIWSNWYPVGAIDPKWPSIPYGKPIRNAVYHVLDRHMNPVPIGVPGELHIGGVCLADGYLNRPELTAERFVAGDSVGAARLYKSGDRARYLPDGTLEFLGRVDGQVKIRGYRVEVGEVEAALGRHPAVQAAAVRPVRDEDGTTGLAAFVVRHGAVEAGDLAVHLRATLPDYMVPATFAFPDSLPLTANGKLDRAALAAAATGLKAATVAEPPADDWEDLVAAAYSAVLGIGPVGRMDNFFDLGGHSLRAARLVAWLHEVLGVEVSLATVFDRPTVAGLAAAARAGGRTTRQLERDPRLTDTAPAAPTQRRFWFVDRLIAERATYNVADVYRLNGPLDRPALARALTVVVRRHAPLRTAFRESGGLTQVILPAANVDFPCEDVSGLPEPRSAARRIIEKEAATPFDLSIGPVFRARLIRLSATEHLLLTTAHHIAFDESSRGPLLRDLWAAYGRSTADAELPLRYFDFAAWEADRLAGPDGDRLVAAWRSKLEGAAAPVVYPASAARPAKPTGAGRKHEFALPEGLTARVAAVARETGSTPFIVSAAAFQVLLHRVSGQVDICIGTAVQVRPLGTADLVGCFVNTVPLRTDFTGQPTFRDLLGRTRSTLASALANADLPFDRLVEELAPARGADGRPLFQTAIVHDRAELSGTASGDLSWNLECVATGGAKFDLTLGVTDQSVGWLEYSTDLYDAADADRIAGEYVNLLVASVADPDCPIDELPVLADEEERLILGPWAGDRVVRADVPRLTAFFEEQARLTPLAIALIVGRQELSYRELNARANRLARHLRSLGVGPDTLVGVCLHRTAHLPVALLAVLKAGGAYVPLDPAYPKDRLAFMIADAAAPVLLTQQSLRDLLPVAAHVLRLDADDVRWMDESADDPPSTTGPTDLAYVLYTSGSTGRPKGVAVEHRSAIELMHWARDEFNRSELAGVLFGTSICFDLSVFELFAPLSNGGTVILVDNALRLADAPGRDRVTLLNTVPSAAAELVRTKAIPASVRAVNLAGEPLPRALADVLYAIPTIERVRNLYGPTEDTTYSTWCEVPRDGSPVHIGRPLPNTTAHILDRNRRPVPVGVPGELYLGGAGLARGYLNRPELTAERFTHGTLATSRRYKTGDLCRWRLDGAIDYLGRLDHQVKVRGFRVELGEIEESLRACDGVGDAVVVAADDSAGGKRLIAYVAADGTAVAGIRDRLKLSLPEYMVPATVVALPELPRTANGKVDRAALPAPDQTVTTAAEYVAPANDAERALQTIWEAVLGVRPISVTASFEDLGGHSLLAAALVARIEARLGHLVPLDALFKAPTVRALADGIQQKLELGNGVIVPLNEAGDYPPLYLIAGAGGHVFTFQKFSRLLGDEFPAYGMKAVGVDGVERPLDRIEAIAARYLDEITQERPHGPYVLGGYSVGGLVAFELALQMRRRGLPVAKVVAFDTFAPGYPRRRPWPVRAGIHLTNFFASGGGEKWAYLGQRMRNLRHRILTAIGLGHLDLRATPAVGGLSEWVLKRVWASLERANMRYWPAEPFDGDLVLVSAEKSEDWAATSLNDPQKGWGRWTKKPVEVIQVPAGHMEVFGEENLDLLVRKIRAVIRSTRPGTGRKDD